MFKIIFFLASTLLFQMVYFVDANSKQFKENQVSWSTEYSPSIGLTTEIPNSYQDQNQSADNQSDTTSFSSPLEPYFDAQRESTQQQQQQQQLNTKQLLNWLPIEQQMTANNKFSDTIKQMVALQPMNTSASVQWSSPIRTLNLPSESSYYYPQWHQQQQYQAINNFQEPTIDQLNRFGQLFGGAGVGGASAAAHHYITTSLLQRQPSLSHLSYADQMLNAISNDPPNPRASILKEVSMLPPLFDKLPAFRHHSFLIKPQISTKSPWFKTLATKRRSYEHPTTSDAHHIMPRVASVNFDDSVDVSRLSKESDQHQHQQQQQQQQPQQHQGANSKGLKDYLTPYSTMPLVFDLPPSPVEKKNTKYTTTSEEDHLGSFSDGIFAVAGKSPSYASYSHAMPHYYSAYPHYAHHVAPRKGLEKSLGLSILVGIGAALISFLIISNLFLSVPLFAMTLLQILQGNNLFPNNMTPNNMTPNNYNNNNMPPNNNNQNGSGPTTNGRKRRDLHDLELEERVRKAIDNVYL